MLDLAISSGANEMGGIYFGLSDAKAQQAQSQALDLAVKDATAKHRQLRISRRCFEWSISINSGPRINLSERLPKPQDKRRPSCRTAAIHVNVQINYAFS